MELPKIEKRFQQKDAQLVSTILKKSVDTMKQTLGDDFFCKYVAVAIEVKFEDPFIPGKMATQYMTLGDEEQYLNLACYLTYMVGMMRCNSPDNIEAFLKEAAKDVKHRVIKYNSDNPYQPQNEQS